MQSLVTHQHPVLFLGRKYLFIIKQHMLLCMSLGWTLVKQVLIKACLNKGLMIDHA